ADGDQSRRRARGRRESGSSGARSCCRGSDADAQRRSTRGASRYIARREGEDGSSETVCVSDQDGEDDADCGAQSPDQGAGESRETCQDRTSREGACLEGADEVAEREVGETRREISE